LARLLATLALAVGVLAALPGAASAALVDRLGGSDALDFSAFNNETNSVTITFDAPNGKYLVSDTGADLFVSSGCTSTGARTAECPALPGDIWLVQARDGNDQVTMNTTGITDVCGGIGNDTLTGGSGRNLLSGEEGDDTLIGGPQQDRLDGSADCDFVQYSDPDGHDTMIGNGGNDLLVGGSNSDVMQGGAGDDKLVGAGGNDTLDGGDGADLLVGDAGDDQLSGGAGNDLLQGGGGADAEHGDAGNDEIGTNVNVFGRSVSDRGDDLLDGGPGNDILYGGPGEHLITFSSPFAPDPTDDATNGADRFVGGDGQDTVSYVNRTSAVSISLDGAANDGAPGEGDAIATDVEAATGGSGDDTITGSPGPDTLDGGAGSDTIDGGGGNDTIAGGAADGAADRLSGGAGDDLLHGNGGDDRLDGGDGADRLFGDGGNDMLQGGDAGDQLAGGPGIDTLFGGAGDDRLEGAVTPLIGADGGDTLHGGDGADSLDGGPGDDVLDGGLGNDAIVGGAGAKDVADYSGATTPVTASLGGSAANGRPGEADSIAADVEGLRGGSAEDTLIGSAGDNSLAGGGGEDYLEGGAGRDSFDGGPGGDVIVSRDSARERVDCSGGPDFVVPDDGDTLRGCASEADTSNHPQAGRTVLAAPVGRATAFSPPLIARLVPLTLPVLLPSGSRIDGTVRLTAAGRGRARHRALASGSFFLLPSRGLTELAAVPPDSCPGGPHVDIRIRTAGGFSTRGAAAFARGRGTWQSEESCTRTTVKALAGRVLVTDPARGRSVVLHRGGSYRGLAP
jgi:Ca2+-binding RTX toxin-like protein